HWTDHYVEYGFAVVNGAVGPEFTKPALDEVRRLMGHENIPLNEWTKGKTPVRSPVPMSEYKFCNTIYDQPGIRSPRVALHCQGLRKEWLREIDPASKKLSPWQ